MKYFALLLLPVALVAQNASPQDESAEAVRLLAKNCASCHSASPAMAGLSFAARDTALRGGSRGAAIIPGNPEASLLISAVLQSGALKMPPGGKLAQSDVDTLSRWIKAGAAWPSGAAALLPASNWWSFQKPVRPQVPQGKEPWARNEIDALVLRKLKEKNLTPAREADRATLIRRAYHDLHGLSPTAVEVKSFVADADPQAYEKLIDRLLDSPRYGERWARHWLDLVRYADTAGFELDVYNNNAWRYRDFVIDAFNSDKSYADFVKEQIAGDEYWPNDSRRQVGTGLYCVGPNRDLFPDQADINRVEVLTDYTDTTAAVFQGLTAGCARCHDHKFDPLTQKEYFALQAVFVPAVKGEYGLRGVLGWKSADLQREFKMRELSDRIASLEERCRKDIAGAKRSALPEDARAALKIPEAQRTAAQKALAEKFPDKSKASDDEIRGCLNSDENTQLKDIEKRVVAMVAAYKPKPYFCGLRESSPRGGMAMVPARGAGQGTPVGPGLFSVIGGGPIAEAPMTENSSWRRRGLADFITSKDNPLTARVMINRIWQHHFGRGIVNTPSDFGSRGGEPSNQELLDFLATEFMTRDWSMKQMHRLIMTSATYRQSAISSPADVEKDPDNLYLTRFNRQRLDADEIRDGVLQASGNLNLKMAGRPIVPPLTEEELYGLSGPREDAWFTTADKTEQNRRSIYMLVRRSFRMPMMEVFDSPESMFSCPRRESSTTAPQSLAQLNGRFVVEQANQVGAKLAKENLQDPALITAAWRQILRQDPSEAELRSAQKLLERQVATLGTREAAAGDLCRGLFNLNTFLYVD